MTTFGLALLVFAYIVFTRLIVRPVDQLVGAADRVASGARTLPVPRSGARELIELGASVRAMAERLISEEAALLVKVDELTQTTTRLTQTQAQLVRSERMASVGRLAAGVAHEIGNPIAALAGMQDLMLLDPAFRRRRSGISWSAFGARQSAFIRSCATCSTSRGPRGAPPPGERRDALSRRRVGRGGRRRARPSAEALPRRAHRDRCAARAARSKLPAHRLTQVLLNIVLNAGAGHRPRPTAGHGAACAVAAREADGRVRIDIEDDGPGIAPEVLDRLFEPFVTTKDVGEGTGLGLAVCRGIVESAGGEVGVDAARRRGARFFTWCSPR